MIGSFSSVVNGEIKNVHTKKDGILAVLYTPYELAFAMGRNKVFAKHFIDRKRTNLLAEQKKYANNISAVSNIDERVFRLQNHDIYSLDSNFWFTGICHTKYRDKLDLILQHIDFRH